MSERPGWDTAPADVDLGRVWTGVAAQVWRRQPGWIERLARNARHPTASRVTIRLFGVPEPFALFLGLAIAV